MKVARVKNEKPTTALAKRGDSKIVAVYKPTNKKVADASKKKLKK